MILLDKGSKDSYLENEVSMSFTWGSVERKEQKLHLGLEGDAGGREPKEAGKPVQAVYPTKLSGQKQDVGSATCASRNLDQFIVWFELPQVWCVSAIACALLLPGVLCWSSGWRRRAQRLLVLMQADQQRFSVADLPF